MTMRYLRTPTPTLTAHASRVAVETCCTHVTNAHPRQSKPRERPRAARCHPIAGRLRRVLRQAFSRADRGCDTTRVRVRALLWTRYILCMMGLFFFCFVLLLTLHLRRVVINMSMCIYATHLRHDACHDRLTTKQRAPSFSLTTPSQSA